MQQLGSAVDEGLAQDALALLHQLWELPQQRPHLPLPFPNPVSLLRHEVPRLRDQPYHVSAKLDGTRYMLLLGNRADTGEPYAVLIGRNREVRRLALQSTDPSVWYGTLLDCELLASQAPQLVVFDAVAQCGTSCRSLPYSARMAQVRPLLPLLSPLNICCKPLWPLHQIARVTSEWPQDGLIFMPEDAPVQTGMHRTMYKWKPVHTIDFALGVDGTLRYATADGDRDISTLHLRLQETPALQRMRPPCIVECRCQPDGQVEVLHMRPDKTVANFERTVILTLRNIREQLQLDELVQCHGS